MQKMGTESVKKKTEKTLDLRALRQYRLARVQEQLRSRDCTGALLFEPQNIRYATDLTNANLIWTSYTPVRYAFVPANGLPIMFEYALDTCPVSTSEFEFIDEFRPATSFATFYKLDNKTSDISRFCSEIGELVSKCGGTNKRIAIDSLTPIVTHELSRLGLEIIDGDGLMVRARLIKSIEEIQCLRAAVEVAALGAERIRSSLQPGLTEHELWALLHKTNIEHGGEWIETRLLTSGKRTNPWYQSASDKVIENGELVVFDTDMVGPFGYVGDISRAYLCGDHPTEEQRRIYRLAHENLHHNLELLRPGVTFREIGEKSWSPPEEYRQYQESVGHGAGVQIEFPLLCTRDKINRMPYPEMQLRPGMVICAEAYVGAVGGGEGVKLEQQLVITDTGHDLLTDLPFEERLLH